MGNFNRDNYSRGNTDRNDRETFRATCADCGKSCELPFKPSNGRPVYCRDCFKKHSPEESRGRDSGRGRDAGRGRDRFSRDSRGDREMFEAVCANCGANCKVPFRPTEGKDTLCSKCFEEKGGDSRRITNGSGKELSEINAKLDKILEILNFASEELEKDEEVETVEELEPQEALTEIVEEEVKAEEAVEKPKKKATKAKAKKKTAKEA